MGIAQRLDANHKDLGGGFTVRRLLPAARQRSVGPFVFFDHFGPVTEVPDTNHDVRPHPHIGLATVTYLFEGAMMHRDSLGTQQLIEPGAINWMTAGRGIVHSERRPVHLKGKSFVNHGLQLWVALPREHEEDEASFVHTPAAAIPQLQVGGAQVRVLVGTAFSVTSPVQPAAPTLYLDIQLQAGGELELPAMAEAAVDVDEAQTPFELAIYPVDSEIQVDGEALLPHVLAVLEPGLPVRITARQPARLAVVGGAALDGPRNMWWNFVSSRKERIVQASQDWENQRLGQVSGESEFIPLPEHRFTA